jgi:hypothetical protein
VGDSLLCSIAMICGCYEAVSAGFEWDIEDLY